MRGRYRVVLFDADNTLFDFDATEDQALRRTMGERGVKWDQETKALYQSINLPLWEAFHRGEADQDWITVERFRRFGAQVGCAADPEEWNLDYQEKLGDCNTLLPGAEDLLRALRPHCRIALATNGLTRVQRKRLRGSPVTEYLDGVFISQEMGVGKPDPAYFQRIFEALGCEREETVMVGDTLSSDIQGAVNAGLDSVWYAPGGGESPLPTYTARTFEEIKTYLLER